MISFCFLKPVSLELEKNIQHQGKKSIISFPGTACVTFKPPSKIFIAFPVFTFKYHLYIVNCQFKLAVICHHFVFGSLFDNQLVAAHIIRNFRKLLRYIVFIVFYLKK